MSKSPDNNNKKIAPPNVHEQEEQLKNLINEHSRRQANAQTLVQKGTAMSIVAPYVAGVQASQVITQDYLNEIALRRRSAYSF